MAAQRNILTEESLEKDLRSWKEVASNVSNLLYHEQRDLKISDSDAVVAERQSALQEVKFYKGKLEPYQKELDRILKILPKEKMQRYCELKQREIREGVSSEVSGKLAKLRRGFDRAEQQAQSKLNQLLLVKHECETVLSLCRNHLKWVEAVAWEQAVSLPEEDQTASQISVDQRRKAVKKADEAEMSGKVATKIAKKHNYPDKDITAVCIAVACEREGITGRLEIARKLERGAGYFYKSNNRSHFIDRDWLRTEKGKTGFSSHLHRLREKAKQPKYETSDGTTMGDSIRKDYKLPQK